MVVCCCFVEIHPILTDLKNEALMRFCRFTKMQLSANFETIFFENEVQKVRYMLGLVSDALTHYGWISSFSNFENIQKSNLLLYFSYNLHNQRQI